MRQVFLATIRLHDCDLGSAYGFCCLTFILAPLRLRFLKYMQQRNRAVLFSEFYNMLWGFKGGRPTKMHKLELLDLTLCDLPRSRLTRYLIGLNRILIGISIIACSRRNVCRCGSWCSSLKFHSNQRFCPEILTFPGKHNFWKYGI